jgi:dTDP-4-amino-4,6-dideoxygalactose transaminase
MTEDGRIGFVDLVAQYADIKEEILGDIAALMDQSRFVGGPPVQAFEEALAEHCGVKHVVGCSDGTAALLLAFKGAGLRAGDGVVVPTNSFVASANAVVHAGGTPVFVDCDEHTYLLDLDQTERALADGRARFVLPVHLYGAPCPMDDVLAVAGRYDALVIEDNAQALNDARRRVAGWYSERLPTGRLQRVREGASSVWHLFEYRCDDEAHRGRLQAALDEAGVAHGLHYPIPIHLQRAYEGAQSPKLLVAEGLARTLLSLPIHPHLSEEDVARVCAVIEGA